MSVKTQDPAIYKKLHYYGVFGIYAFFRITPRPDVALAKLVASYLLIERD